VNRGPPYSNVSRGKWNKAQDEGLSRAPTPPIEVPPLSSAQALKEQGARLIEQVHEADPLLCAQCGGPMRIIAFLH
jgi:hypothetical protein